VQSKKTRYKWKSIKVNLKYGRKIILSTLIRAKRRGKKRAFNKRRIALIWTKNRKFTKAKEQ
jgi:hypothetical protein